MKYIYLNLIQTKQQNGGYSLDRQSTCCSSFNHSVTGSHELRHIPAPERWDCSVCSLTSECRSVPCSLFSEVLRFSSSFARNIQLGGVVRNGRICVLSFLINTAIIDAFLIMKGSVRFPKKKYRQLDFRVVLAQVLIGIFRTPLSAAVRRQQSMLTTTHKFVKLTNKDRMTRIVPRLSRKRERTRLMVQTM